VDLDRPPVHPPEFPEATWIHTPTPLSLAGLRGRAVLVHIWDFTSIHSMRTLPYLRAWHERYSDLGLVIIGVHIPTFAFGRSRAQVEAAAGRLGIRWPIVLDNDRRVWQAYACHACPSLYLIDGDGTIRYQQVGEGAYRDIELAIQALLSTMNPARVFPAPLPPVRAEDAPGVQCWPTTADLETAELTGPAPVVALPLLFEPPADRSDGRFYLEGLWRWAENGLTLAGQRGAILLPYHAASVHAVLSPSPGPVELDLGLKDPLEVLLVQDGEPLPREAFAEDVFLTGGQAHVRIDVARLYALVRNPDVRSHELRLEVQGTGLTFYAFSFGSCLEPAAASPPLSTE
jgi:hypothetical protein